VYPADFPDPHVLRVGDAYYGYSTNSGTTNLPVIRSSDLVAWERVGDGMTALPAWAKPNFGNTWAPGVIQIGDQFVLYFVARDKVSDRQCIGVDAADKPEGPFHDESSEPFICQRDLGGSIDPYPFLDDDGQLYIHWKNDGNCCAKPVELWVQPLSADGLALEGKPVALISRDQAWEIPLIENPAVVRNGDSYFLFYSANWWESANYALGYAICETALGPCVKPQEGPVFETAGEVAGPGGEAFVTDVAGNLWMTYHAWTTGHVGYPVGMRSLRIDRVTFDADGNPAITGPTSDPQPLP
jgi:beta-xylosidase